VKITDKRPKAPAVTTTLSEIPKGTTFTGQLDGGYSDNLWLKTGNLYVVGLETNIVIRYGSTKVRNYKRVDVELVVTDYVVCDNF
jgi:hypothetical protein